MDSYAAFVQVDYDITDTLTLTGGIRYTVDEKSGTDSARYVSRTNTTTTILAAAGIPAAVGQGIAVDFTTFVICGGPTIASCLPNPLYANVRELSGGGLTRNLSGDYDAWSGTLGLQWQPDGDTNAYARYSRGYKSGGWQASSGLAPFPYADPEYVDNFELGLKKNVGRRFQLNSALFYADYKGFQAPLTVVLNPTTGSTGSQFLNLDAVSWGLEMEAQWAPIDQLQIFASYSYLNTELKSGCCFVDTADLGALQAGARPTGVVLPNGSRPQTLVGNRLPLTPENKFNLGLNYTIEFAKGDLILGGTYTFTDEQQAVVFAQPGFRSPSNEVVDFRALWKDADNRYTSTG